MLTSATAPQRLSTCAANTMGVTLTAKASMVSLRAALTVKPRWISFELR